MDMSTVEVSPPANDTTAGFGVVAVQLGGRPETRTLCCPLGRSENVADPSTGTLCVSPSSTATVTAAGASSPVRCRLTVIEPVEGLVVDSPPHVAARNADRHVRRAILRDRNIPHLQVAVGGVSTYAQEERLDDKSKRPD